MQRRQAASCYQRLRSMFPQERQGILLTLPLAAQRLTYRRACILLRQASLLQAERQALPRQARELSATTPLPLLRLLRIPQAISQAARKRARALLYQQASL